MELTHEQAGAAKKDEQAGAPKKGKTPSPSKKRSRPSGKGKKGSPKKAEGDEDNSRKKRAPPTVNEQANATMASLYWDLNYASVFQAIINTATDEGNYYHEEFTNYANLKQHTSMFINNGVHDYRQIAYAGLSTRATWFIDKYGWQMFAICAQSESFQLATTGFDAPNWLRFDELMTQNARSVLVFARSRGLEWRGALLSYVQYDIPSLNVALNSDIDLGQEHPHHTVQLPDGHLKRPICNGRAQVNMNSSSWNPANFPDYEGENPALRQPEWNACAICHSKPRCQCRLTSLAGDMVELVEGPLGTGVRSLANFKANDVLGEYVGELAPYRSGIEDNIYAMNNGVDVIGDDGQYQHIYINDIFPSERGNWTRFMNHHCNSNVEFRGSMVGDQAIVIVKAIRDIAMFETITVHYGHNYWSCAEYDCLCGAPNCIRPPGRVFDVSSTSSLTSMDSKMDID
ncbi:hypothetical protein N7466_000485 [Penicillium verhagenii]|uniref:uncharacterized protein n=1 Tax=Penicillium verhagenii TaxID=1562060 RepID=UPI0025456921|nr:uncharacterized protein N7466_000485 [Penicillium verhagenii]KAJ5947470.1 hypothetical protein N7466_000485 [Penicillium verhagenii]